jgi:serine/threonine protein kinase
MSTAQTVATRFKIADLEKDLLGRGVMSTVYRGTDALTGELVAIKALDPGVVVRSPEALKRFLREGEILRQLNHPNIVKMIDSVEEAGRHYLVMEYVPGGSLQGLLAADKRLASRRVIAIALALADALACAHRLGILHRDLKPANILLAGDGTPRITDFGCAFIVDRSRLTQAGVLVGTGYYLSPEALLGQTVDERADIWALGVMLFELLAGQRPFSASNFTGMITAILMQPVPDLASLAPDCPEPLIELVCRMLEKEPQQRIASMEQVGNELKSILRMQ